MKPIVYKCRVLLECESTSYELRVVGQQGCKLQTNERESYEVTSLWGCEQT